VPVFLGFNLGLGSTFTTYLNDSRSFESFFTMQLAELFTTCEQLQDAGKTEEALLTYKTWLNASTDPNRFMGWFNYGSLLQSTGNTQAAEVAYRECLVVQPRFPQALINLGLTLEKLGKRDEALQQWASLVSQRYLQDAPPSDMITMALNHIGRVQEELKHYDLAEQALEQSLAIDPKQVPALQHWIHIRQKSCAWPVYKPLPNITPNAMLMATSPLAMLALTDDPVQQLLTAFAFVERTYSFKQEFLCAGRQYNHARKRIGFVSGDLCVHAVGLLLAELIEGIDRTTNEVVAYDFSPEDGSAHRARLKAAFDHVRFIHTLTDRQVAEQILADEIDVLIDLHGLSSGARPGIFALHPAPKQGTYLGFIGTTGMPWFDFVITDKYALPEELARYFTEKPLYVEGSFIPLTRDETPVREVSRSEFGLKDDAFVMAAFGNVYKITPEMFATWMELLKEIPRAVLWIIDDNATTTNNLKAHAVAANADLSRIQFTPRTTHIEYRAKLRLADVFLDTFPYNCGSTANDVVQAGVPIVTMSGRTMVSRMGGSILQAIDMSNQLISGTYSEYKAKIRALSKIKTTSNYYPVKVNIWSFPI
jgi:predicted O-linked N-acetylglucosamine transferase (SPINDLY family)